jgi:hypothetical protein
MVSNQRLIQLSGDKQALIRKTNGEVHGTLRACDIRALMPREIE